MKKVVMQLISRQPQNSPFFNIAKFELTRVTAKDNKETDMPTSKLSVFRYIAKFELTKVIAKEFKTYDNDALRF